MDVGRPAKLFVLPRRGAKPDIRLLDPRQATAQAGAGTLFKKLPEDFALTGVTLAARPEDADFLIVPQSMKAIGPEEVRYLDEACATAREHGKRAILFLSGDYAHRVHAERPELIVFKGAEYGSGRKGNEVVFAPFVEDLGQSVAAPLRAKGEKPVISFCGYAGLSGWRAKLKYHAENLFRTLAGDETHKRGIYFRKKAMRGLTGDGRVETRFIVRDSFSGNLSTASSDAATLRKEYVDSIVGSDFVLCPKGDANYSSRFYETLSLGRIPVLIDTDMVLPLAGSLDYDSFIVRVPHQDAARAGDYVLARWNALSGEEWNAMQARAKAAFRDRLRYDSYFNTALPLLTEGGIPAVL
jgi:hypothetical protein